MTARAIALTGISGVGKSTLIKALAASRPLEHLQASTLIKEGRDAAGDSFTQDQLRLVDVDENQQFLVEGFWRRARTSTGLVILDCHTVIERGDELVPIGPAVFQAMAIRDMIFRADDPKSIAERRRYDSNRNRPQPSIEIIRPIQETAWQQAIVICRVLGVTINICSTFDSYTISDALNQQTLGGD